MWLPDGRILFSLAEPANDGAINLWGIAANLETGEPTGKPTRITNWQHSFPWIPTLSSDGRRLAILKGHTASDVFVAEWRGNDQRLDAPKNLTQSDSDQFPNGWFSDSCAVLFTSFRAGRGQISRLQLESQTVTSVVPGPDSQIAPEITPDGLWILYWSDPSAPDTKTTTLRVMRAPSAGGTPEQILQFPPDNTTYVHCPSHPGSSCVLSRWENDQLTFYAFDASGGQGKALAKTYLESPKSLSVEYFPGWGSNRSDELRSLERPDPNP